MRNAVFLDRDGTINEETGYLHEPEKLVLIPGAAQAIKRLNIGGWAVVCISNQSGVARGYFPVEAVERVNERLKELLALEDAFIDRIYFCPHHPLEGNTPYRQDCLCRKPEPGMIHRAANEMEIDLCRSYLIGDSLTDLKTAFNSGLRSVLVLTGYGKETLKKIKSLGYRMPDYLSSDLAGAVDWILEHQ